MNSLMSENPTSVCSAAPRQGTDYFNVYRNSVGFYRDMTGLLLQQTHDYGSKPTQDMIIANSSYSDVLFAKIRHDRKSSHANDVTKFTKENFMATLTAIVESKELDASHSQNKSLKMVATHSISSSTSGHNYENPHGDPYVQDFTAAGLLILPLKVLKILIVLILLLLTFLSLRSQP